MLTSKLNNIPLKIIFQKIEGLHNACPNHKGDWYFTGNYPTPGGNRVVNQSFINFFEGKSSRAYQFKYFKNKPKIVSYYQHK